jgi:hypothetical protein
MMNGQKYNKKFLPRTNHLSINIYQVVKRSSPRRRISEVVGKLPSIPLSTANILSLDHAFRNSLSPIAKEACSIVDRIRDEEQKSTWTSEFEDMLAQKVGANVYPGMMFSLAKARMEKTKLWQIIRKMPKGALLHAHMDAMVDFDFLFDVLLKEPGMHIHSATALASPEALEGATINFRFLKSTTGK